MANQAISTENAPAAVGPYSQAVRAGGFLFVSGQIPVDPATGDVASSVEDQARQSLKNVGAILEAAGTGFENVVKTTVFIQNMADFAPVKAVYAASFQKPFPAPSCIEASPLPEGGLLDVGGTPPPQ